MITIVITEIVVPNSEECMYTDLLPIEIQNVSTFVPWVKRRKNCITLKQYLQNLKKGNAEYTMIQFSIVLSYRFCVKVLIQFMFSHTKGLH